MGPKVACLLPLKCRVCGCTDTEPCNPPCAWEPGEGDLCTTCGSVIDTLHEWKESALHPSIPALVREFKLQEDGSWIPR